MRVDATTETVHAWFVGHVGDRWFRGPISVRVDRDEIQVVLPVDEPELDSQDGNDVAVARLARVERFREDTREDRMRVAQAAESRYGRKVSWGAACGGDEYLFTTAGVPVMTRLRMAERAVLDTLIDAGVARSRSEALAWCVRLVGEHQGPWIDELREALIAVERLRAAGPGGASGPTGS